MVRHDKLGKRIIPTKNDVTSSLPSHSKTDLFQCTNTFSARNLR